MPDRRGKSKAVEMMSAAEFVSKFCDVSKEEAVLLSYYMDEIDVVMKKPRPDKKQEAR